MAIEIIDVGNASRGLIKFMQTPADMTACALGAVERLAVRSMRESRKVNASAPASSLEVGSAAAKRPSALLLGLVRRAAM